MSKLFYRERVQSSSTTTGTGGMSLSTTAVPGFLTFAQGVTNGSEVGYLIAHESDGTWEVGVGTWNDPFLNRTTVLATSADYTPPVSGLSFAAGTKYVSLTPVRTSYQWAAVPASGTYAMDADAEFPTIGANGYLALGAASDASGDNAFAVGGTASGANSVTLMGSSTAAGAISVRGAASATDAIALLGTAQGVNSVAVGAGTARAIHSVVLGGGGSDSAGSGYFASYSLSSGGASAIHAHSRVHGAGFGKQFGEVAMSKQTTDATPAALVKGGNATTYGYLTYSNDSVVAFDGLVLAKGASDRAAWLVSFCMVYPAGTATLVGTPTVTLIGASAGAAAWTLTVTADTTNRQPKLEATGAAATTIDWLAALRTCEIAG